MHEAGMHLWYDEGITPGSRWSESLANAIDSCSVFLVFISNNSVQSENCRNEIDYALKHQRPFVTVYLDDVELPPGLELNLGNRQAIVKSRFSDELFREKVRKAIIEGGSSAATQAVTMGARMAPARAGSGIAKRRWVAGIVGTALVIAIGLWVAQTGTETDPPSIAVLPFDNLSGADEYDYVTDGLADELINQLGAVPGLGVASRTSSFYYKTVTPSLADIRDRLLVNHWVEGSVRVSENELVVNARLIDATSNRQRWTQSFRSAMSDASEVPATLAEEIIRVLIPNSEALRQDLFATREQIGSNAYDAYLRGLDYRNKPPSPESLTAAINHFERAIKFDPDFARALAGLCDAELAFVRMVRTEHGDRLLASAQTHCNEALTLDNTVWEGRQSLATLHRQAGQFKQALAEIRLADALRPDTALVLLEFGKILFELDQVERAEEVMLRAIKIDPGFWGGHADLGDQYFLRGMYAPALAQFQRVRELSPENSLALVSLGAAHYMLDQVDDAETVWRLAVATNPLSGSRGYWQSATWLGFLKYYQGCFEAAAYWHNKAAQVSPNDHRLWGRLAENCALQETPAGRESGRAAYGHAIELAERDLQQNPNDWDTLGLLSLYRARVGEDDTRSGVARMMELQPNNADAIEIAALYAHEVGDEAQKQRLLLRLEELGFPQAMIDRSPVLNKPPRCPDASSSKERLRCDPQNGFPNKVVTATNPERGG